MEYCASRLLQAGQEVASRDGAKLWVRLTPLLHLQSSLCCYAHVQSGHAGIRDCKVWSPFIHYSMSPTDVLVTFDFISTLIHAYRCQEDMYGLKAVTRALTTRGTLALYHWD